MKVEMKRRRRKKPTVSDGQIAFDEMRNILEYYRNKMSGMLFVGFDDETVINPEGKMVEYRSEFYEKIEMDFWELSEKQRSVVRRHFG